MSLKTRSISTIVVFALIAALTIQGAGAQAKKEIVFPSRDYVETAVIAEIVKHLVEAKTDIQVRHLPNIDFRVTLAAMQTGDVDMFGTYSGSLFTTVLGQEVTEEWLDPNKVLDYCVGEINRVLDARIFGPQGFDNTYAVAVRRDYAEQHNLNTVSDLKALAPGLTIATDADFLHREEVMSYTNFIKTYGLKFKKAVAMTYGLMYRAAQAKNVDVIMAYSSDGRIAAMDLKTLDDDLQFFPPYDSVLIVSNRTLAKYPEIAPVLELLTNNITQEDIQKMNARADVDGDELDDIAKDFLKDKGLI